MPQLNMLRREWYKKWDGFALESHRGAEGAYPKGSQMREAEIPVLFEPQGNRVFVLKGTRIIEAAARAGAAVNMPCGGQGTCGKCKVRVLGAPPPPTESEQRTLTQEELETGVRLACQSCVSNRLSIEIPASSLLASSYQILTEANQDLAADLAPALCKRYLELPKPTRDDPRADLDRLLEPLGEFTADLSFMREFPGNLRAWGFSGTAVLADHQLIAFERGNTENACYSLAFDVGTTSIVGVLLDLTTGCERASVSRMNAQTRYGDDVVARILHARQKTNGLAELHQAVIRDVNEMAEELAEAAGVSLNHVYEATFAGNTTMQQLLLGLDPSALGEVPFVPVTSRGQLLPASELGLAIHPRGRAYVFPAIGGFLGGDIVAGVLATGLEHCTAPTVFIDIGTNGEIVLSYDGRLFATSTAAGPAFEGARITHGVRACQGAIEKVLFDSDVRMNVIGDVAPIGLCGSALIDVAAELLRHGVLVREGLLLSPRDLPSDLPPLLRERVIETADEVVFLLATREESGIDAPIFLTQRDLRELQLAAGAIRAGTNILLRRAGVNVQDLDRVLVAGGFGNFIRRSNAQRLGLLPAEVAHHRIAFVGNAALAGARLAAVSQKARERAESLAHRIEHIDLSLDPDFQREFVEAMMFPEPCPRP